MRLTFDPRAQRLLRTLPRTSLYAASELLLLAVLAWQVARLIWAIVTPVSPLGDWRPADARAAVAPAGILAGFDPFFRIDGAGGIGTVTDLDLKLFGVRADAVTGRGSAIIGPPQGKQQSYAVGDEIAPGVTLQAVRMDGVTILRDGARQMLFLDQSPPAGLIVASAPPPGGAPAIAVPAPGGAVTPAALAGEIAAVPRIQNGAVDGVTLQPRGGGDAFRAAGLQPGDVLLSVNGTRVQSAEAIATLPDLLGRAAQARIEVERGGRIVPLDVGMAR